MSKSYNKRTVQGPLKREHSLAINWNYIIIALAVTVFVFSCLQLDITQDDAYISFRYAANYLSGHGLVYNYGERVEGYTNFLWVMLLALFKGVFGVSYFTFSRIAGVISGAMIFYLLYLLLQYHFRKVPLALFISLAVAILSNLSLPYWSISGLETAAFACIVLAAVVAEYRYSELTPVFLIIATMLRPEGVVVFGVVLTNRIIIGRRFPWRYVLLYIIPLLPFAVFKLAYYGSLFPNPYYAKSGTGLEYILSGLEYLLYFTRTVGVYGIIFLIPLLTIRRLWSKYSLLYMYVLLYVAYIVWVGGDVLKVYRFFVPVVPVLYFLFIVSLVELASLIKVNRRRVYSIVVICSAIFSFTSYSFSQEYILASRKAEVYLVDNMQFIGTMLKKYMGDDFSLGTSTIGMIGYQLVGYRVIDMLGLTEPLIARHPEQLEGMVSSWKERRFNNTYLLEQKPDFILFSTGTKPSSPAERALMLHSEFRHNYSTISFVRNQSKVEVWQRRGSINMLKDIVHHDIEFINKWSDGLYHHSKDKQDEALADFREARQRLGEDFSMLSCLTGKCFLKKNVIDSAIFYIQQALMLDTLCWEAHINKLTIARTTGDTATFINQINYLKRLSPWMFDDRYQYR